MKSFAGTEELQASFRSIGLALVRAEDFYFSFGYLGRSEKNPDDLPRVFDFLRQELVGIKTGDLELYVSELQGVPQAEAEPEYLALDPGHSPGGLNGWICRALRSAHKRRQIFAEALSREIRRRHGESDEGDTAIPAGLPLQVPSAVK